MAPGATRRLVSLADEMGNAGRMEPFLRTYRSSVLDQHVDVLSMAYARAKEGQTQQAPATEHERDVEREARRLLHRDVVLHRVLDVVEKHVRRGLYTVEQLYTLLQLFAEEHQRFTAASDTETLRRQATLVNRKVWKELRNLLMEQAELSRDVVDWSLAPACWQPLLSHLARECILWAYAAAIYVPGAALPREKLQHVLSNPVSKTTGATTAAGSDLQWGPIMEILMTRLRVDMHTRQDMTSNEPLDDTLLEELVRLSLRRSGSGTNGPLDGSQWQELIPLDDLGTDGHEPDDVTHLRTFIRQTDAAQRMPRDALSRQLASFDFSRRLLLRFAYTGYTHVQRSTPSGDVNAIRAQIIEALTRLDFRPTGDADLGEALGWLTALRDSRQHFGDIFERRLREVLTKTFPNKTDDPDLLARCQEVCEVIQTLITAAPVLETSQWLRTYGTWDTRDTGRCARLAQAGFAETLQQKLQNDLRRFKDADGPLMILEECSAQEREHIVLLGELWEAYEAWQGYASRPTRIRQRLRKYFTALCRRPEDKGLHSTTVMTMHAWLTTTEALWAAPVAGILQRYANVWQRLARLLVPASDVTHDLDALRPHLAPVPGLPRPGASTVTREA